MTTPSTPKSNLDKTTHTTFKDGQVTSRTTIYSHPVPPTLAQRLVCLERKLRRLANSLSRDAFHADDLFQEAAIRILTTCTPEDSDSTIYLRAKSAMYNLISGENTYNKHVAEENAVAPAGDMEEETDIVWDYYAATARTPEDEVIQSEELANIHTLIKKLHPENQKVIKMLASGKSKADIARELGVSRAAVTIRVSRIAEKLDSLNISYEFF